MSNGSTSTKTNPAEENLLRLDRETEKARAAVDLHIGAAARRKGEAPRAEEEEGTTQHLRLEKSGQRGGGDAEGGGGEGDGEKGGGGAQDKRANEEEVVRIVCEQLYSLARQKTAKAGTVT